MPVNNPYDFTGQFSQGAGGAGAINPYGGYLTNLSKQRESREQTTYADAMGKLRAAIAEIAKQQMPQAQGALATEPKAVAPAPSISTGDLYDPEGYLYRLGNGIESNNDYTIVNKASGAGGKYQFLDKTWRSVMKEDPSLGLTEEGRTSNTPEGRRQQENAVRYLTKQNVGILKSTLGRAPTHAETYLAHLLGPGYASAVLRAPTTPVQALVPTSFVEANPFLRGITGEQLLQMKSKKFNPMQRGGRADDDEVGPHTHMFLDTPSRRRRMFADTTRPTGWLHDVSRVLGDRASFGVADHLEGLTNSVLYGTDADSSLKTSGYRTERAGRRIRDPKTYEGLPYPEAVGSAVGTAADLLGTLGGYGAMLPRLPMWLAGRGLFTPAAVPAEFTRGYLETQGDPYTRLQGGARQMVDAPENLFNPMTGRGLAANMFYAPTMEGAGLGELTPSAYLHRVLDAGGVE